MKLIKAIIILILATFVVSAQNKLPVIKSNSSVVSIQDGEILKKSNWTLTPEAKPDVYETNLLNGKPHKVTFITDVDSISFTVEEGKNYDFIIQKGDVLCYTRIVGKKVFSWDAKEFWESSAINTPYKANISEDEKIAGLSKFWSEAKYNFVNFDLVPDLSWDAAYMEYLPKVRQTKSTLEYYRLLQEMCAKLKDGHTNVYAPDELADVVYSRPLIRTRLVEDKVLVIKIFDDSLRQKGIEVGQEIVEIDGLPVKEYAAKFVAPQQSSSTPQDLQTRTFEYSLLNGAASNPLNLTLRNAEGKTFQMILSRLAAAERSKLNLPPTPPFEFKMLPGNVVYVALNSFGNDKAAEGFIQAFDEIAKSDALIIDVRNNGGGNSSIGWLILSYLTDKPFKTSKWYTRDYRPAFRAWEKPQQTYGEEAVDLQPNGKKLYSKPVIVLTSSRTFSAAEDFAVSFVSMKRGTIVGEPTGGSTGQPMFFNLPGGGSARICTKRDKFPDGREFVGVGVQPDKLVRPTIGDVRANRDTVLEAALATLKRRQ